MNKQRCGSGCGTSFVPRKNLALMSQKLEDSKRTRVEARDRRILELPLSMSHREVAKLLQAEGWFSSKTTAYYIEYRVRRVREKGLSENI